MRWWKISQFEYEHRRRAAINIGAQVRLPHRPCLWLPKVCSNWFARSSNMINPFSWTIITLCARTHGVYATRNGAKRNAPSFISINVITSRRVAAFHHWWLHFGQSKCNLIVVRVSTRLSLPYRFFPSRRPRSLSSWRSTRSSFMKSRRNRGNYFNWLSPR